MALPILGVTSIFNFCQSDRPKIKVQKCIDARRKNKTEDRAIEITQPKQQRENLAKKINK